MKPETILDCAHDVLLNIRGDVAQLADVARDDGATKLAACLTCLRDKIDLQLSILEPALAEHLAASAKADRDYGQVRLH